MTNDLLEVFRQQKHGVFPPEAVQFRHQVVLRQLASRPQLLLLRIDGVRLEFNGRLQCFDTFVEFQKSEGCKIKPVNPFPLLPESLVIGVYH